MSQEPISISVTARGERPKEKPEVHEARKKVATPVYKALKAAGEKGLTQEEVIKSAGGITDDAIISVHWLRAQGVGITVSSLTPTGGLLFRLTEFVK